MCDSLLHSLLFILIIRHAVKQLYQQIKYGVSYLTYTSKGVAAVTDSLGRWTEAAPYVHKTECCNYTDLHCLFSFQAFEDLSKLMEKVCMGGMCHLAK